MIKNICLSLIAFAYSLPALAQEWPQFRGPDGQGHALAEHVPITWSETEGIAWKTAIPGLGWSSPVVTGDQIWLTTAVEDTGSLQAVCVNRQTGELQLQAEILRAKDLGRVNSKNS